MSDQLPGKGGDFKHWLCLGHKREGALDDATVIVDAKEAKALREHGWKIVGPFNLGGKG